MFTWKALNALIAFSHICAVKYNKDVHKIFSKPGSEFEKIITFSQAGFVF